MFVPSTKAENDLLCKALTAASNQADDFGIEKLDADEKKLHGQLLDAATDHARVAELNAQLIAVQTEKEQVETDWLAAAELAES